MSISLRVRKLEETAALDSAVTLDSYVGRWDAAYIKIGSTMVRARAFQEINAEITSHLRLGSVRGQREVYTPRQ